MKKILVITDSHSHFDKILKMVEKENPDIVISAGDYSRDAEELSYLFKEKEFFIVNGNGDFFDRTHEDEILIEIEGKKFFITHGHFYGVKSSYDSLRKKSLDLECDITIFGHTHRTYLEKKEGHPILYNPGAAMDGKYGIVMLHDNDVEINTMQF